MTGQHANKKGVPQENFAARLVAFRNKWGFSQESLGKLLGVTGKYLGVLERGREIDPSSSLVRLFELLEAGSDEKIRAFADRYAVSPSPPAGPTIYSEEPDGTVGRLHEHVPEFSRGSSRIIRVLSWVQAGQCIDYEELPEDWQGSIATDCPDPKAFGVEIRGDSMEPRFGQGEVVIAMPSYRPRYHDFVIARLADGGAVFKLFNANSHDETIVLTSLNPLYTPIHLREDQITWCYPVWGVFRKLWIAPSEAIR